MVIHVMIDDQINDNCFNEPFAVSPNKSLYWDMHGLISETSIWLLAGSTRLNYYHYCTLILMHKWWTCKFRFHANFTKSVKAFRYEIARNYNSHFFWKQKENDNTIMLYATWSMQLWSAINSNLQASNNLFKQIHIEIAQYKIKRTAWEQCMPHYHSFHFARTKQRATNTAFLAYENFEALINRVNGCASCMHHFFFEFATSDSLDCLVAAGHSCNKANPFCGVDSARAHTFHTHAYIHTCIHTYIHAFLNARRRTNRHARAHRHTHRQRNIFTHAHTH